MKRLWALIKEGSSIFSNNTAKRMADEFSEDFPGRCMICAYHEYGVREGLASGKVADHDCIEGKK